MEAFSTATVVVATVLVGLVAGLLAGFSYAVMPGLRSSDDRTLVTAMQRINVAILNPVFGVILVGAPVITGLAVGLHLPADRRAALPWLVAALLLYGAAVAVTAARNVPLNNQLAAVAETGSAVTLAEARRRFEAPWTRWNLVRAVASTAALGCLAVALVRVG